LVDKSRLHSSPTTVTTTLQRHSHLYSHTTETMSDTTMQAQVHEAGLQAAAAARGHEAPTDSPAVDKVSRQQ
jgi:hypothetical protein